NQDHQAAHVPGALVRAVQGEVELDGRQGGQIGEVQIAVRGLFRGGRGDGAEEIGPDPENAVILQPPGLLSAGLPVKAGATLQVHAIDAAGNNLQVSVPAANQLVVEDQVALAISTEHEEGLAEAVDGETTIPPPPHRQL